MLLRTNRDMKKIFLSDPIILSLILINSLVIFASGFDISPFVNQLLFSLDAVFTFVFITELIVKMRHYGVKGYFSQGWNIFDFSLVVISIPSILVMFFNVNLEDLSFLLVFRTLRTFKLFRFFTFIPDIDNLLNSIIRGFKASVLILISFTLFIFVSSTLSFHIFNEHEVFNNPATSLYTTFKIFTIEGWNEIPDMLTPNRPSMYILFVRLYFVGMLIVGGIFGLSFVNAVLVDSMVQDNTDDLEDKVDALKEELQEIKELLKSNISSEK